MGREPRLSDMLEDPEVIDVDTFDLYGGTTPEGLEKEAKKEEEKKVEEVKVTGDKEALSSLVEQVRQMRADFEAAKDAPPPTPAPPEKTYTAPSTEDIAAMLEDGNIAGAMQASQQQFAVNNFLPAMKALGELVEKKNAKVEGKSEAALDQMAANAVQSYVASDPALEAIAPDIYENFKGFSAEQILQPGVIDNVVSQVVGHRARRGEFTPSSGSPTGLPPASGGAPVEDEVPPEMMEVFKRLTGAENVDAATIRSLSKPHSLNFGQGEG